MKRLIVGTLLLLMSMTAMAQHRPAHHAHPIESAIPNENVTLVITASRGELFTVYIDGDLVNRTPQRQVVVDNLNYDLHDVYVVLNSPENKITMMSFRPNNRREECLVHYDRHRNRVELLLPEQVAQPMPHTNPFDHTVVHQPEVHVVQHCADEEVDLMVEALHNESFDSTREKLAMNYVENHRLCAYQILRLAQEFTFNSSKKDFLKVAYPYCADPENYAIVVNCLTFTSDKEEILNMINR